MSRLLAFILLVFAALGQPQASVRPELDPALPDYKVVPGVQGTLNSIGSDTLNNLMSLWTEAFRKEYPQVKIQVEGKGSSTAPPALIMGTAQLAPMSRKMKASEMEEFEANYGFLPTAIGVALDSLSIYVHRDNPLHTLSLEEVDAIFSTTRNGGLERNIITWGQLGLQGDFARSPLSLYGRNSASGTNGYFKREALFGGDFKATVKEQPGSASVVSSLSGDVFGIGYSGIGYMTSSVKALKLSRTQDEKAYQPSYENVLAGKYPLARMLYVYVAKKPNRPLDHTVKEFLKLVLSKRGQEIVIKDGYLPLTGRLASRQLALLE